MPEALPLMNCVGHACAAKRQNRSGLIALLIVRNAVAATGFFHVDTSLDGIELTTCDTKLQDVMHPASA